MEMMENSVANYCTDAQGCQDTMRESSRVVEEKERKNVLVPSEERSLWRYYDDGGGSAWMGNNTCHRPRDSHVVSQSVVDAVTDWW